MLCALKRAAGSSRVLFKAPSLPCLMRASWGWTGPRRKKPGRGGKSRSSWRLLPPVVQGTSLAKAGDAQDCERRGVSLLQHPHQPATTWSNRSWYLEARSHFKQQLGQVTSSTAAGHSTSRLLADGPQSFWLPHPCPPSCKYCWSW